MWRHWDYATADYRYTLEEWSPHESLWMFRMQSSNFGWARRNALHYNIDIEDKQ